MTDAIEPGSLLPRYLAGEHEQVWREMAGLGGNVRGPPWFDDAWAVARETMRRARHNVELIVQRLDGMGYQFWNGEQASLAPTGMAMSIGGRVMNFDSPMDMIREAMARNPAGMHPRALEARERLMSLIGPYQAAKAKMDAAQQARVERQAAITDHLKDPNVFSPADGEDIAMIRGLEAKGLLLPLSWRAWIEVVGQVNLAGAHPALCFWEAEPNFPGVYADPLMVTLGGLEFMADGWETEFDEGEEPEEIDAILGWDPQLKARLAHHDELLDEGYAMDLPNAGADGALRLGGKQQGFVDYLRHAFKWGGFPGWDGQPNPPARELALLTEGLLAL
jgi:hypothetical protein